MKWKIVRVKMDEPIIKSDSNGNMFVELQPITLEEQKCFLFCQREHFAETRTLTSCLMDIHNLHVLANFPELVEAIAPTATNCFSDRKKTIERFAELQNR